MRTSSSKSFRGRLSTYVTLAVLAATGFMVGIRAVPAAARVPGAAAPAAPASLDALIDLSGGGAVTIPLQNNQTGMCLDSDDGNPVLDGVYTSPCNGSATEQWYAWPNGLGGDIIMDSGGLCLSSPDDTGSAPGPVYTETCTGGDTQSWSYNDSPGSGGVTWAVGSQGTVCLDSDSGPAWYAPNPSAAGNVWVAACASTGGQLWNSWVYPGIWYTV